MDVSSRSSIRALWLVAALLALSGLVFPAVAQDKPEPRYKPYPVKKRTEASETPAQEETAKPTASTAPSTAATVGPFGVTPSKSLHSRPPTSGKEPMMRLDADNKPLTEPVHETDRLVYYECRGTVAPWFAELLVAETNYFNELVGLPFVDGSACVVSLGAKKSLSPGRLSVHLYNNVRAMNDCVRDDRCTIFRSVSLVPKSDGVYRSYFLSDLTRKLIAQHCVTPKGKWHRDTTCYNLE
jgi:hypothetical protein